MADALSAAVADWLSAPPLACVSRVLYGVEAHEMTGSHLRILKVSPAKAFAQGAGRFHEPCLHVQRLFAWFGWLGSPLQQGWAPTFSNRSGRRPACLGRPRRTGGKLGLNRAGHGCWALQPHGGGPGSMQSGAGAERLVDGLRGSRAEERTAWHAGGAGLALGAEGCRHATATVIAAR